MLNTSGPAGGNARLIDRSSKKSASQLTNEFEEALDAVSRLASIAHRLWIERGEVQKMVLDGEEQFVIATNMEAWRDMSFLYGEVFERAIPLIDIYDEIARAEHEERFAAAARAKSGRDNTGASVAN